MAILGVQHIGIAVRDFYSACRNMDRCLGMKARDFRDDQGKGMQYDARVLLGNDCWIHIVQNWNPESRVSGFLQRHGEGLEHVALETDDIESDVGRLRDLGVPIFEDTIFDANDGYEAFVYPEDGIGFTVELIQPHEHSWTYPADARGKAVSTTMGVRRLHHIGAVVREVGAAAERFERLFGLKAAGPRHAGCREGSNTVRIALGNPCWLHLEQPSEVDSGARQFLHRRGEGLQHLALETATLDQDLAHLGETPLPFISLVGSGSDPE